MNHRRHQPGRPADQPGDPQPGFFLAVLGAPLLTAIAAFVRFRGDVREAVPRTLAGLVLSGATLIVTIAVNVPLNDALAAAGPPDRIVDLAACGTSSRHGGSDGTPCAP